MRYFFALLLTFPTIAISDMNNIKIDKNRPTDFVDVKKYIPEIQTDMRYFSENNFIGRKVNGYQAPICLLTMSATKALQTVVAQLLLMGLTLKVYDCYRPQTAVNDFANWATESDNVTMRAAFYPTVDKNRLFSEGYINNKSGHSRGRLDSRNKCNTHPGVSLQRS